MTITYAVPCIRNASYKSILVLNFCTAVEYICKNLRNQTDKKGLLAPEYPPCGYGYGCGYPKPVPTLTPTCTHTYNPRWVPIPMTFPTHSHTSNCIQLSLLRSRSGTAVSAGIGREICELNAEASDTMAIVPFDGPAIGWHTGTSTPLKCNCFFFQMALCTSSTWAYAWASASQSSSSMPSPGPLSIMGGYPTAIHIWVPG